MVFALIADNAVDQYPIGLADIKRRFPNISFQTPLEGQDLSSLGVVEVATTQQPTIDTNTQKLQESTPVLDGSTWRQVWDTVALSADELQQVEDNAAASVRGTRNTKLSESDWTQANDSPLASDKKTEWATYRQSLRDLPTASGFPHTMTWPTEPS